jgi:hypothetical protein
MVEAAGQRRFRISISTLMIAIALCAVLITPVVWTNRRVRQERLLAELARAQADQALYLAQVNSTQAALKVPKQGNTLQSEQGNLWAGLGGNHLIFRAGQTKDLRIQFSLVNDGDKAIDPKIAESRIMINGKEVADSDSVFAGVPKDVRSKALAPGESLQFDVPLGDHFNEPGVCRISWQGVGFQSSEIELRILPDKGR